jgi:DNA-binding NarL/FixJ family response regulator
MTQVLIAAPTPALRAGLRALLGHPDIEIIGETTSLAAETLAGDVVVVGDAELLLGLDAGALDAGRPALVVLADDERPLVRLRALAPSGWGIVPRDASASEIQAAVASAAQGLAVMQPALLERLGAPRQGVVAGDGAGALGSEPLTPREQEVLELLSQGLPNKLIARQLAISEHTVKFHVSSLIAKLGAGSRTDAVSRAARLGLIVL